MRSLLLRYPERIWSECGHWLNLAGEWTPTEDLTYSLTMQSLVAWKHLFKPISEAKLRGEFVPQWRDGKVVWVRPEEVELPPAPEDQATPSPR